MITLQSLLTKKISISYKKLNYYGGTVFKLLTQSLSESQLNSTSEALLSNVQRGRGEGRGNSSNSG